MDLPQIAKHNAILRKRVAMKVGNLLGRGMEYWHCTDRYHSQDLVYQRLSVPHSVGKDKIHSKYYIIKIRTFSSSIFVNKNLWHTLDDLQLMGDGFFQRPCQSLRVPWLALRGTRQGIGIPRSNCWMLSHPQPRTSRAIRWAMISLEKHKKIINRHVN